MLHKCIHIWAASRGVVHISIRYPHGLNRRGQLLIVLNAAAKHNSPKCCYYYFHSTLHVNGGTANKYKYGTPWIEV